MTSKKPNIIFCTCDQLRAFEIGCYGNKTIKTPNIDNLAASGLRFEIGISNNPLCMPARSIMLSGEYSRTCSQLHNEISTINWGSGWILPFYPMRGRPHLKDPTLPEILRSNNYYTATIGKWHIQSWPHDVGFDYYLIPRTQHCHIGQHFTENGDREVVPEGFSVDFEVEKVGEFLQSHKNSENPFFLFYNISPPHLPYDDIPEYYKKMYKPEDMPIRENAIIDDKMAYDRLNFISYLYDYKFYNLGLPYTGKLPENFDLRHLYALYYGSTSWVDDAIGKLLENLKTMGLEENTIVIFTADHGDNLGSHGWWQKGWFNQESSRIPFIWRVPGQKNNEVVDKQVGSLVDITPTLLDLVGIDIPEHIQGQSLAPIIRGESETLENNYTFIESTRGSVAIRTPKYIFEKSLNIRKRQLTDRRVYLFDLEKDPFEYQNIADSIEHKKLRNELENMLEQWNNETSWLISKK
jgi:choline-sulfatase